MSVASSSIAIAKWVSSDPHEGRGQEAGNAPRAAQATLEAAFSDTTSAVDASTLHEQSTAILAAISEVQPGLSISLTANALLSALFVIEQEQERLDADESADAGHRQDELGDRVIAIQKV